MDKIKQLAIEQHKTEAAVVSARAAQERAEKTARQSKSKELAANALLESSKEKDRDETLALRLAYTALKVDTTEAAQNIFDKIISRADNQFYLRKVKGYVCGFNRDSSRFLTYDRDSTRLNDWTGKGLGSIKGFAYGFNQDSSRFLTNDYYKTHLSDWKGDRKSVV